MRATIIQVMLMSVIMIRTRIYRLRVRTPANSVPSLLTLPKLPKLEHPKFTGKVTEWSSFWDLFNTAIHSNANMSKVNKFNYVFSLLEGNAARSVKGLTLTSANYDAAIEILQERFGKNPQQIIAAHMNQILQIPACPEGRTGQLRFVFDKMSVHVRGLASLGIAAEQYSNLLMPVIMTKLPSEIRLQIARKATNDVWQINDLVKTIKSEIEAREMSEMARSNVNEKTNKPKQTTVPTVWSFIVTGMTRTEQVNLRLNVHSAMNYIILRPAKRS